MNCLVLNASFVFYDLVNCEKHYFVHKITFFLWAFQKTKYFGSQNSSNYLSEVAVEKKLFCFPHVFGSFSSRTARICVGRPCRPREPRPKQHASPLTSRAAASAPVAQLDLLKRRREKHQFYWKSMHFPAVPPDAHLQLAREPRVRTLRPDCRRVPLRSL